MAAVNNTVTVSIEIEKTRRYNIKQLALMVGDYSTGYIRGLERSGKIPKGKRDEKGWRYWEGDDVVKIIGFMKEHKIPLKEEKE